MRTDDKCEEEKRAVEQAGKAVRQLGSLLFEMEVLRSFLETEAELRYFDNRVSPSKVLAHRVVNNLKGRYFYLFSVFETLKNGKGFVNYQGIVVLISGHAE